jgi:hypothetical protein
MDSPRTDWRWLGWAGAVAIVLTLAVPINASGLPGGGAPLPPPNTCIAPLLPCYIVLSIDSGSRGNNETVTGARFWPGEPFTVYFWNGTAGASATVVASGSTGTGSFSAYFRVPKEPVGSYTVFVTDLAGDNQSAAFQLTHLSARPDSGPVGNVTAVSGQGFLPDHAVRFHIHGAHAPSVGRCQTNSHGNFSDCRISVPNVPAGATHLIATDGTYTARIEFVVS